MYNNIQGLVFRFMLLRWMNMFKIVKHRNWWWKSLNNSGKKGNRSHKIQNVQILSRFSFRLELFRRKGNSEEWCKANNWRSNNIQYIKGGDQSQIFQKCTNNFKIYF